MSSFTASEGEMPYDQHASDEREAEARSCTDCGRRVWVGRDEAYTVQVFCALCARRPLMADARDRVTDRRAKAKSQ